MDFVGFPKIARWSRDCVVTEKIDGTNGQIWIPTDDERAALPEKWQSLPFVVASRSRYMFPPDDNHGFSHWAYANQEELLKLGPGRHFGEWWGQGIQRKYGLNEKRFSLFNVKRWEEWCPTCCLVVPTLWEGSFDQLDVWELMELLKIDGSHAAPGFMRPEGIVIHHIQGRFSFKKTFENDEKGKGE